MEKIWAVLILILTCRGGDVDLSITLIDDGDTPPLVLAAAQSEAGRVLMAAGARVSWKRCPPSSLLPAHKPCAKGGSNSLWVRILNPQHAASWPLERASCGLAVAGTNAEPGYLAIVDSRCVERMARSIPQAWARALGHVIAHEIGHLLLGRDSHSASGLMSAAWTAEEQALLIRGSLHFTPDDRLRIRAAIESRAAGDR